MSEIPFGTGPTSGTRIILVRHGQTVWNEGARFQGHLDSPLTSRGEFQVRAMAARLASESIAAIYTSDLGRAVQTASLIGEKIGIPIHLDLRLRERCLGIFQGLCKTEIHDRYPAEAERYYSRDPDFIVPQGESARERFDIGFSCLREIASRHAGEEILVVTHGGLVAGMFRHVVGLPFECPRQFSIENAAFNSFWHAPPDAWVLQTWRDTSHLRKPGRKP